MLYLFYPITVFYHNMFSRVNPIHFAFRKDISIKNKVPV